MTYNKVLAQALFEQCVVDESLYTFSVLLEDRIQFIKNKYKGAADSIVDHISTHVDPTKNKKYTEWLVDRHLKGDDVVGQAPIVKEGLKHFEKAKPTAHDTNIKNHTIESMLDVAHLVATSHKGSEGVKPLEKLYDSDGVTGYKIPNRETSVAIYGSGRKHSTRWCTAANSSENMFEHYAGGKYTMHFPNGHFLQFNHSSNQLKDPSNTEITLHSDERYKPYTSHIKSFVKSTAKTENLDSLVDTHFGIDRDVLDHHYEQYKNKTATIPFLRAAETTPLDDEHVKTLLDHEWHSKVFKNQHLTEHQANMAVDHVIKKRVIPTFEMFNNHNVKGEALDRLIAHTENVGNHIQMGHSKNLTPAHVDRFIDHAVSWDSPIAAQTHYGDAVNTLANNGNFKFSDDQVEKLLAAHHYHTIGSIGEYQQLPESAKSTMIERYTRAARHETAPASLPQFSKHNKIESHDIDYMIDNAAVGALPLVSYRRILGIHGIDRSHIDRIVNHIKSYPSLSLSHAFIAHPNLPHDVAVDLMRHKLPDKLSTALNGYMSRDDAKASVAYDIAKGSENGAYTATSDPAFYKIKDFPKRLLSDPNKAVRVIENLQYHPTMNKDDLHTMIDAVSEGGSHSMFLGHREYKNLLNHPNINASHIKKLYDAASPDDKVAIAIHPRVPPSISNKFFS